MDTLSTEKRALFAIKRLLATLGARLRRALGSLFQIVTHDQLGDLSRQTQRLSSASVESVTYLGSELRALDRRLSRMEDEIAALRALLEQSASEETASGPSSG
jgi:hypothetical protein